jgi:hypothetical protein
MSDRDEYNSVADRIKSAQPRVHSNLTARVRERIYIVTANPARVKTSKRYNIPEKCIDIAIRQTMENVGVASLEEHYHKEATSSHGKHAAIIRNASTDAVLTYIEHLLITVCHSHDNWWEDCNLPYHNKNSNVLFVRSRIEKTVEKINITLETEGILWKLKMEPEKFNFYPIGSELMQDSDQELSVIAQGKKWKSVISPYNEAYNQYLDRTYNRTIPEKLYNSIEELARTICVDLEDWETNREQSLSVYLETMREKELFEPNNIMAEELNDLSSSMERAFQKAGAERKNRHSEIDREYTTLLLHQISAYLTFLIRQYEKKYED